jgi:hypothetical protein
MADADRQEFGEVAMSSMPASWQPLDAQQPPHSEARQRLEQAIEALAETLGPAHEDVLDAKHDMLILMHNKTEGFQWAQPRELAVLCEHVVMTAVEGLGLTHKKTIRYMETAAATLCSLDGHVGAAGKLHDAVVAAQIEVLGPQHKDTLASKNRLLIFLNNTMDLPEEAAVICEDLVMSAVEHLGVMHESTILYMKNAAVVFSHIEGRADARRQLYEGLGAAQTETLGATQSCRHA